MQRPWDRIDSHWLRMVKEFLPPPLSQPVWTAETQQHFAAVVKSLRENRPSTTVASASTLLPLVGDRPNIAAVVLALKAYGELQMEDFDAALASLSQALLYQPGEPHLIYSTGLVELRRGRVEAATELFEQALQRDTSLGLAWAALAVIRALEQDHVRCEQAARQALARGANLDGDLVNLALLQSTYRLGKTVEGGCDFTALAHDSATVVDRLLPHFPPVLREELTHPDDERPVLFLYADNTYFERHAIGLILSLDELRPHCRLHLHVVNPGHNFQLLVGQLTAVLRNVPLAVSTETAETDCFATPSVYYSCMRYVRLLQLLEHAGRPTILLDVDLLARRNPLVLFENHPAADVVLSVAEFDPLWGQIFAGAVAVRPTAGGLAFVRRVASLILDNLDKKVGRWFLDQIALAICFDENSSQTVFATVPKPSVASRRFHPESLFSSVVNEQKQADNLHNQLKRELLQRAGLAETFPRPR
jgi:hypothetical protein